MGLGIFLNLIAAFSPKWSVPWYTHCLEVPLSPLELPSSVSLSGYSCSPARRKKHICVFSHSGEGKAGQGKKQQLPAGSRSLQGQAVPGPAAGGEQGPGTAWPWPSCLLPPTIWKHSTVFFQPNAKHFTPGNQWWQVDKSFPFAAEGGY